MRGSFVATQAGITASLVGPTAVVHADEWPGGPQAQTDVLRPSADALLAALDPRGAWPLADRSGALMRVPVMITRGMTVPQRGREAAAAVVAAVPRRVVEGVDLLHGHVGYIGGLAAVRVAPAGVRVVVTEHSTGLPDVLADADGREIYAEVLERSHRLLCVSEFLRRQVVECFPQYADRVQVAANPVDIVHVPVRTRGEARSRWIYVGGLIERKGVVRLVTAFAVAAAQDPELTLTLVGEGALREDLERLVADSGVADRVTFWGILEHAQALALMAEHDVLVHLSSYETFGLSVVEAAAAGLGVVVARSGGCAETVGAYQGRGVELVEVSDDPLEVVAAFHRLRSRVGSHDPAAVRADLEERYGYDAGRRRLADAYGVDPAVRPRHDPVAPLRPTGPVTVVATTGGRAPAVRAEIAAAQEVGLDVVLVTAVAALADTGARTVAPQRLSSGRGAGALASAPAVGLRARVRGLVRGGGGGSGGAAAGDAASVWVPPEGSSVLVGNPQSFPTVVDLLAQRPDLRLLVELPALPVVANVTTSGAEDGPTSGRTGQDA
jgi:glycogen(starch) synthase